MLVQLRRAVVVSVFFVLLLGLAYPFAETGIAQAFFSHQANGSLTANGSTLIGQKWKGPTWFHGRPGTYDAMASGPTNLGPRSKALKDHVAKRVAAYEKMGIRPTPELVTSSGSGLDPDISPSSAYAQVASVARARHLSAGVLHRLVADHVSGPTLGFLGASHVNVLKLNEALARMK